MKSIINKKKSDTTTQIPGNFNPCFDEDLLILSMKSAKVKHIPDMKEYLEKRIKTLTNTVDKEKIWREREMAYGRLIEMQEALKVCNGETDDFIELAILEKL